MRKSCRSFLLTKVLQVFSIYLTTLRKSLKILFLIKSLMILSTGHSIHKTCVQAWRSKRMIYLICLRIVKYNTSLKTLKRLLLQSQNNNPMNKILKDKPYLKLLVIKPPNSPNGISKLLLRPILLTITTYLAVIFLSLRPTLYGSKYRHI